MKNICIFFLCLAIAISFAEENEDFDTSSLDKIEGEHDFSEAEEAADALVRSESEGERQGSPGCKNLGERCDKDIGDCNCCGYGATCSCSWLDFTNSECTCQVGSAADNYNTCMRKKTACNVNYDCGKRPCTRAKGCGKG